MLNNLKKILLLVISALVLSSCACDPVYIKPQALPLPAKPEFIEITDKDVADISQHLYEKLKLNNIQHDNYEKELEAIILSTHD